jgi:hypothetical protein
VKKYLPVVGIAAVGVVAAALVGASTAAGAVGANVGPVRANALAAPAYAAVSWPGSDQLSGAESLIVRVFAAPTASARVNVVGAAGIGAVSSPASYATIVQPSSGVQAVPGSGRAGALGFAVDTAGFYSGVVDVYSGATLVESATFSFATTGAPVTLQVTPSTLSADVGGAMTAFITLLDAAGNRTQPAAIDGVVVTTTVGQVAPTSISGSGDPRQSLSDGLAEVTLSSQAAGTGVLTVTPTGTLPAGGLSVATVPATFRSLTPSPSPTPSSSATPTPSPTVTPTPSPTPTVTPSPTVAPTPTPTSTTPSSPSPTPTPSPAPSDPDLDGDEEAANSIEVFRLASGYRVAVNTIEGQTLFRVVAVRPGSSVRWTWKDLRTNDDGEFAYRTSRNLSGARMRLLVDGVVVARVTVPAS